MKRLFLFSIFLTKIAISATPPGIPSVNQSSWLISGIVSPEHEKLINSVRSYPAMGTFTNEDGVTITAHQYPNSRTLSHTIPPHVIPIIKNGNFSVLRGNSQDFANYPKGATLFKQYPSLATKFDNLIAFIIKNPGFKTFFNKIHLNVLNELYAYLMNIYANFNVQHTGIKETQNTLTFDVPLFLQNEANDDANKKTLIINHLVNIIESQMNGKIKSIMPTIPHLFATTAGKILIQNDYSIDLTNFIIKQIEPDMIKYKQTYLEGLAVYLSFFQEFTSYLLEPHPKKPQHFTAFVYIAESINEFLFDTKNINLGNSDPAEQMTSVLKKMNPPLFTFNYDDIRALKLIPHLAKSISKNSKLIGWPSHLVKAAQNETFINQHPIAYFKDNNGLMTTSASNSHLFIVLQSGKNFFEEELLEQPEWLNSWDGVARILRACFGDFSALIGLFVLDPCMETLIQNGVDTMNGKVANDQNSLDNTCSNMLRLIKNQKPISANQSNNTQNTSSALNNVVQNQITQSNNNLIPSQNNLMPASNNLNSPDNIMPSNDNLTPLSNNITPSNTNNISLALNQ